MGSSCCAPRIARTGPAPLCFKARSRAAVRPSDLGIRGPELRRPSRFSVGAPGCPESGPALPAASFWAGNTEPPRRLRLQRAGSSSCCRREQVQGQKETRPLWVLRLCDRVWRLHLGLGDVATALSGCNSGASAGRALRARRAKGRPVFSSSDLTTIIQRLQTMFLI